MKIRTGYSFRTAVGHLSEVADRVQTFGWSAAPISDRNSTFGFVPWTAACEQRGLRPVYGVELAVVPSIVERKPIADFWTFFAIANLRGLNELVSDATSNSGRFPCLTYAQAQAAPDVLRVTGERTNLALCDPQKVFVGLSPSIPRGLYREAKREGFRFMATGDNVYTNEGDKEFYRVALGSLRSSTQTYPQHILDDDELALALPFVQEEDFKEAFKNRDIGFELCQAKIRRAKLLVPEKPKSLRQLCVDGAAKLKIDLTDKVYEARLDRELTLIDEKEFEDYFFIIADLMREARTMMVVGPARGSSCGSLVCYLLGITAIDPIPYNLVFERFIDTTRADLPDIDIDFSDKNRHFIFEYMEEKYGLDRVARLGSVGMFKSKSSLNQSAIALRVPEWKINEVSNTVIKRSGGDSRAGSTVEDTLRDTDVGRDLLEEYPEMIMAGRLEGHPNNAGQHAAGMVLTQDPVLDFVAIDARNGTTMCNKYDAETLNLLKIDMLGLTQLSIFERVLELIGEVPTSDFLEAIPRDCQAAFDVLNDFRFAGIFQFTPDSALSGLVKQVVKDYGGRMSDLEDIVALTALVRPGPLGGGAAESWIRRRTGHEKVEVLDPALEPFMKTTLGIIIYQEQVLQIGRELGDLSWAEVTALRKAMSKSLGKEYFDQFGDKFKASAKKKTNLTDEELETFWDELCGYGMWAFNRSHSVAYGVVSYWCCWLKAHHPVEFAAATLDAFSGDASKQIAALREMKKEGVDYVAIDPDLSVDKWTVGERDGKKLLIGPLTNIKGIGPAFVSEIMTARDEGVEVRAALMKRIERAETPINSLTPVADAVERMYPEGIDQVPISVITEPTAIVDVQLGIKKDVVIVGKVTKLSPLDENEPTRVAKRGGRKVSGPTSALNMFFGDDTDTIFAKIGRYDFERLGPAVIEKARVGRSIFAVKGPVPKDFRMVSVKQIKYLGEIDSKGPNGLGSEPERE